MQHHLPYQPKETPLVLVKHSDLSSLRSLCSAVPATQLVWPALIYVPCRPVQASLPPKPNITLQQSVVSGPAPLAVTFQLSVAGEAYLLRSMWQCFNCLSLRQLENAR